MSHRHPPRAAEVSIDAADASTDASADALTDASADAPAERRTRVVVGLTLVTMVVELVAGYTCDSMALITDGWHMGTHAAALSVTLYAYAYARRCGYTDDPQRVERVKALGGFASAVVLMLAALYLAWESLHRLVAPREVAYAGALLVAGLGLLVNMVSAALLGHVHSHTHTHPHTHPHLHGPIVPARPGDGAQPSKGRNGRRRPGNGGWRLRKAHEIKDLNLRGAYLHVLADALVSLFAIGALAAGWLLGVWQLDPLVGLVGGVVIARWSVGLLRDTGRVLLAPSPVPG